LVREKIKSKENRKYQSERKENLLQLRKSIEINQNREKKNPTIKKIIDPRNENMAHNSPDPKKINS